MLYNTSGTFRRCTAWSAAIRFLGQHPTRTTAAGRPAALVEVKYSVPLFRTVLQGRSVFDRLWLRVFFSPAPTPAPAPAPIKIHLFLSICFLISI